MSYDSIDIRNVCLVGPSNSGKTQLAEALLYAGGAINKCGSVNDGDTVLDFMDRERRLGHSLYPAVCHLDHKNIHVNLIDTPGYRDFYGRAVSVMPAADTAAIVINAQIGHRVGNAQDDESRQTAAALSHDHREQDRC